MRTKLIGLIIGFTLIFGYTNAVKKNVCMTDSTKCQRELKFIPPEVERGDTLKEGPTYRGKSTYYYYNRRRYTASGQLYRKNAMTAAHKTLAFGTKVRVTNLRNGKVVYVTINDRGPYGKGNIIDLSYGAAKKIGILKRGITDVEITVIYG